MNIPQFEEIIEPNDQTQARHEHLEKLRELVGNVYPNKFERSKLSGEVDTITSLIAHAPVAAASSEMVEVKESLKEGERPPAEVKDSVNERLKALGTVRIAGRLTTPPRGNFVHLTDGISKLQIYCDKKGGFELIKNDGANTVDPENGWTAWKLIDHGDFVGVEGYLFVTNTGEVSLHVEKLQFLAKAMLPMPDKMHGIADPETRQRQRYADLIASSLQVEHDGMTTREVFETRAKVISSLRRYLEDHGYIEVETPMLTPKATGAAAKPFVTHHNALDITLYARIAPELYLKRLVVGGFEKVYELNRNFRNEGISYKHNPEFTMLEFYCAYMDVNGMMDFCEEMMRQSVQRATGGLTVSYEGNEIDFGVFERIAMKEAIMKHLPKADAYAVDETWFDDREKLGLLHWVAITATLKEGNVGEEARPLSPEDVWKLGIQGFESAKNRNEWDSMGSIVTIFELLVEENLIQPTFIVDYPKSISHNSSCPSENV
jgi:lysyl-tRNA synthetase class 2